MTQKSAARKARDAARKNDTSWSDIEALYVTNRGLLGTVTDQVSKFFSIEGVVSFIPQAERQKTISAIRTLGEDVKAFMEDLNKIHATHAGRTGALKPEEDIMQVIELSEAYIKHEMQVNAIVIPTYHYLLSVMAEVERKSAELASKAEVPETTPAPV